MGEGGSEGGESGHSDSGHEPGESSHGAGESRHERSGGNESHKEGKETSSEKNSEQEGKKGGTIHGSVAIICYEDPETGKVEFYLEEKPQDYAIKEYRGKLAFVGGTIESNETNLEALLREFGEEVQDKNAQSILRHIVLTKGLSYYDVLRQSVKGEESRTYVYVIKVDSRAEWDAIKNSSLTHDAGPKRVLALEEIVALLESGASAFAFDFDKVLVKFINQFYGAKISDYKAKLASSGALKQQVHDEYLQHISGNGGNTAHSPNHQVAVPEGNNNHMSSMHPANSYWNPAILYPMAASTNPRLNMYPAFSTGNSKLEELTKRNSYFSQQPKEYRRAA